MALALVDLESVTDTVELGVADTDRDREGDELAVRLGLDDRDEASLAETDTVIDALPHAEEHAEMLLEPDGDRLEDRVRDGDALNDGDRVRDGLPEAV